MYNYIRVILIINGYLCIVYYIILYIYIYIYTLYKHYHVPLLSNPHYTRIRILLTIYS